MNIKVEETQDAPQYEFEVLVDEGGSSSRHIVTMNENYYKDLDTQLEPEEVIKESFEFLLEREPKEMILSEFDITVISRYFPEFKQHKFV